MSISEDDFKVRGLCGGVKIASYVEFFQNESVG